MTDQRDRDEEARREVKITDRRRVRLDGGGEEGPAGEPAGPPPADEPSDELAQARAQATEYLEDLQRLKAEFDNYRKRIIKEQTRALETAAEPFVGRLLEVLDEFELALVAAEQKPEFEKFLRGVEIVFAKLLDVLRAEGVERIEAQGKPFDPSVHEALFQVEGGEGEPYVADVLRPGYTLRGRVIRPAGVKVARR